MRFPYTEVGPGVYRPIVPLSLWGPAGAVLVDGLLDTGADRTLVTPRVARSLGIDVIGLQTPPLQLKVPSGQLVACRLAIVIMGLSRHRSRICWHAEIAVALEAVTKPLWGFKGFLEYFRTCFDGPQRRVTLTAGNSLPKTTEPAGAQ
jgi:hypothetical protein